MKFRYILPFLLATSMMISTGCDDNDDQDQKDEASQTEQGDKPAQGESGEKPGEVTEPEQGGEGGEGGETQIVDPSCINLDGAIIASENAYQCNGRCVGNVLIKTEEDYEALGLKSNVAIDFSKNAVMVIHAGEFTHGGYVVKVASICGDQSKVTVSAVVESCSKAISTSVMTYPRAYVIVPISEIYEVKVSEDSNVCDAPMEPGEGGICSGKTDLEVKELYASHSGSCNSDKCRKPGFELIKTEEEYEQTLLYNLDDIVEMPDMEKYDVLIVYAGEKTTGGYGISVSAACSDSDVNKVVASIDSCAGAAVTEAFTYPISYFRVPASDLKYDVTFESNTNKCEK